MSQCLHHINAFGDDPEHQELREFHGALLLGQLRGLWETDTYFRSYPWHTMVALDARKVPVLLEHMKATWNFVLNFVDSLSPTSPLGKALYFTRFQPFRDVFTKAEPLNCYQKLKYLFFPVDFHIISIIFSSYLLVNK